jgi:alpha-L-rhamnosidase
VAGIEIDAAQPGYKHSILRPQPGDPQLGLKQAGTTLQTPYGELVSQWQIEDDTFDWRVVVPPNTTATVYLPVDKDSQVVINGQAVQGTVHSLVAGEYRLNAQMGER